MENPNDYQVDRTGWPKGPWDDEPDRIEWRFEDNPSLVCLMVRNQMGAWCGYVGLPAEHPFHGDKYDDHYDLNVHGGPTYSAACAGHICHVPEPGEPDNVWWIGFDCGHWMDRIPSLESRLGRQTPSGTYRDVAYVKAEVESLARQLANSEES